MKMVSQIGIEGILRWKIYTHKCLDINRGHVEKCLCPSAFLFVLPWYVSLFVALLSLYQALALLHQQLCYFSFRERRPVSSETSPSLPSTSLSMPTPNRSWQMRMEDWGRCSCSPLELWQVWNVCCLTATAHCVFQIKLLYLSWIDCVSGNF